MGLDNIPVVYPCKKHNTAIMSADDRIDCEATIDAGQCPHRNAAPQRGSVLGMLGTYCWYRGKYGAGLLENVLNVNGDALWGTGEDNLVSPSVLHSLADQAEAAYAELTDEAIAAFEKESGDGDLRAHIEYLIWYLRWSADECDGLTAWY